MIVIIVAILALILFICFGLSVASYSYSELLSRYKQYDKELSIMNVSAVDFASSVNAVRLNHSLNIQSIKGELTDKYSPGKRTIYISENNLTSPSVSALSVTAHELGHAIQNYNRSKKYDNYIKVYKIGRAFGFLMLPLFLAGIILMFFESLFYVGIVSLSLSVLLFILALILKILNISVEKEASKIGIELLKDVLDDNQLKMAKRLLKAALLTYWGDFFRAILAWTFMTRKTKLF